MAETVISIDGLTKHFSVPVKAEGFAASVKSLFKRKYKKVKAVEQISFDIKEGEMVGFLGPNGHILSKRLKASFWHVKMTTAKKI